MNAFNLPPGVSCSDIDRAAGDFKTECCRCSDVVTAYNLNECGLCSRCEREEKEDQEGGE